MDGQSNHSEEEVASVETLPILRYRLAGGGARQYWSPARRVRPACGCWRTYSYPNRVVMAVADERRELFRAVRIAEGEVARLQALVQAQYDRIVELEGSRQTENAVQATRIAELEVGLQTEHERADILGHQVMETHDYYGQILRKVGDRATDLMTGSRQLLEDVVGPDYVFPGYGAGPAGGDHLVLHVEAGESAGSVGN